MTYKEVLHELESAGSEQTRKTYARHGVVDAMFGVSYATMGALKKKIKTDHKLAEELWRSGNHDARILATMIADPSLFTPALLDTWAKDVTCYPLGDALAEVTRHTPSARTMAEKWIKSADEMTASFGWSLFGRLAREEGNYTPEELEPYLATIEKNIHKAKNRVRHSMNGALISIGLRNPKLQKLAITAAGRIGKVTVDHGTTACTTPDAAQYILKVVARESKKKTK